MQWIRDYLFTMSRRKASLVACPAMAQNDVIENGRILPCETFDSRYVSTRLGNRDWCFESELVFSDGIKTTKGA